MKSSSSTTTGKSAVGARNTDYIYSVRWTPLQVVHEKSNLGVPIGSDLKQTKYACKEADILPGFTGRNFECETPGAVLSMSNSLVRTHLEYTVQFWSPNHKDMANAMPGYRN